MNTGFFVICCLLSSFGANADMMLRAGDLEKICTSAIEEDRSICSLVVKAYKDGFIEGVANGSMGTYRLDPQVWATVKDVNAEDFAQRLNHVVGLSTCIQNVQVDDLTKSFSAYVKQNPSERSAPYRTAMFRTIEGTYCKN